jgi:hypothetical protein
VLRASFAPLASVIRLSPAPSAAEAEGFVGDDERCGPAASCLPAGPWRRPGRWCRACRSAFAFVVTLMDAGLRRRRRQSEMAGVVEAEPCRRGP